MDDDLRLVRSDALPEEFKYVDEGCDLHPRCLTCPFDECRYAQPGGVAEEQRRKRNERIAQAMQCPGATVADVAEQFGVSKRSLFRILSGQRRNGA